MANFMLVNFPSIQRKNCDMPHIVEVVILTPVRKLAFCVTDTTEKFEIV